MRILRCVGMWVDMQILAVLTTVKVTSVFIVQNVNARSVEEMGI